MQPDPPFFVFDGDCGFCRKWATWLHRRLPERAGLVAYQQIDDLSRFGLSSDLASTASYWVEPDGTLRRGAESFSYSLRHARRPWPLLGLALRAPLVRSLATRIYPVVARNRHRLPAPKLDD